jgi:ABC-type uncharacterized transport system substrate-binding protein
MKKAIGVGVWILVMVCALSGAAFAAQKVLVVAGVSETVASSMEAYEFFIQGIRETLGTKNVAPEFLYVDFDGIPDDAGKIAAGNAAVEKIKGLSPDVVMVLNDNTLKYVGLNMTEVPVVFAFVFGAPDTLGLPKPNITGVARRSYAADIWKMAKELTGAKTVALISKNTFSMAGVKQVLSSQTDGLEKLSGVRYLDMFLCDTFEQWEKHVKNWPAEMIYLADASRIKNGDKEMTNAELVAWTVSNATVPVIASNEEDTRSGALFSIVADVKGWGSQASEMVLKVLAGTPIAQIPMETVTKGALLINAKTASKMGVEIPYEILSTAEKVYE